MAGQSEPGEAALLADLFVDHSEVIDARMNQKALEARHAGDCERLDVRMIAFDHAAPCSPIDSAFTLCGCTFCLQRGNGGRRGQAVQGHVDQQCVTSGGSGARRGIEAFPLAPSRVVDVDVRIDQARKNGGVAEIVNRRAGRYFSGRNNRLDPFPLHQNGGGTNSVRGVTTRLGDEGLQGSWGQSPSREEVGIRSRAYRARFTFSTRRVIENSSREKFYAVCKLRLYLLALMRIRRMQETSVLKRFRPIA